MAAKVEEAYSERTEKVNAAGEMVEVNLDGDPAKRLFFRRLAVEKGGEVVPRRADTAAMGLLCCGYISSFRISG